MIELVETPDGVLLPVRAQAGASASGLRGEYRGALKVAVTQVAEKGKANKAISDVLARGLLLKSSQVELVSGGTRADKKFLIRSATKQEVAERIEAALAAGSK